MNIELEGFGMHMMNIGEGGLGVGDHAAPGGLSMVTRHNEAHWYADAVIYIVSVRAFRDSNGDGCGDINGLRQVLPYLQELGISCLWLLPFYPSPSHGHDIADFRAVDPTYGTLDEFREFLEDAHACGIRVLIDLPFNHTSVEHPWFQRARSAPRGSPERDFYVWRDERNAYNGTRVLLSDYAVDNWTFDPVAGQYYWHRHKESEPDLNFESAAVRDAMMDVVRFWLDLGLDGLVLDAVAFLFEREGTTNEGLDETHDLLTQIRREVDTRYAGRVLVARPARSVSDARRYFGAGDECHLCCQVSFAPRLFQALYLEDAAHMAEVVEQSRGLPEGTQWALVLRDHDELRLDLLSEEERDSMFSAYGFDARMRLHVGIRRRLAPLVEDDALRIELLVSVTLSLRGTPVLYYGDEIGMGDNIYLGDCNGMRTPMQWGIDRNSGFSHANPQSLYLPPIMDPVWGYGAVNVESQLRQRPSLLNRIKRMIALRQRYPVFGRGDIKLIPSTNRKVLAYLRDDGDLKMACVANLSRHSTVAQLDLREYAGDYFLCEVFGQSDFPPIGEDFYSLTLGPYAFFWFELKPLPVDDPRRAQFYSCFISYSTQDEEFASRLYRDLLDQGVRCWYAPHDMRSGRKIHHQIDEAMSSHERVLLILSPHSMASEWVMTEIAKARKLEVREGRQMLFPIGLASFDIIQEWECFDADIGKDSAREVREYFIPDFSRWRDERAYNDAFQALIRSLRTTGRRSSGK